MALYAGDVDLDRDRDLVRRFQAGEGDAFDELYRRYYDRLERFCRKRVGDPHTAEEVAQEAFARALTALPDLGGDLRFYPWVSVIAAHLCVDSHRRQSRSEPSAELDPGAVAGGQDDIVDAVDASLVIAALARLAPRHQDVLHLREVECWSYRRIADHYGVTVGTVETLLFRARRALRREFRIVDGSGLAGIPVLAGLARVASRARSYLPAWLSSPSSPASLAGAATATAAAVALVVVPGAGYTPARPALPHSPAALAAPPATTHQSATRAVQPAAAGFGPGTAGSGSGGPALPGGTPIADTTAAGTSLPLPAAAPSTSLTGGGAAPAASSSTSTAPAGAGVSPLGTNTVGTLGGVVNSVNSGVLTVTSQLPSAPVGDVTSTVTGALPPLSSPVAVVPSLSSPVAVVPSLSSPVAALPLARLPLPGAAAAAQGLTTTVGHLVNGLLPGV